MIHCEKISDVYTNKKMALWLISAFKAGFINAIGFLLTGKFVSHVTGFGTQMGVAVGHSNYFFGLELLVIPISYILGGVITAYLLEKDENKQTIPPYHYVQGIITFLTALLIIFGEINMININTPFNFDNHYNFMELLIMANLCLICGLKNSLSTWTTHGKIRVTHLTGIATDIGLNLIAMIKPRPSNSRFKEKKRINFHRMATFIIFSLGSFVAAILFPKIGHNAFYIIFIISLSMTIVSFQHRHKKINAHYY
jgi:uncharacterized membrane protein YoaK (UPF0700 family)